MSSLVEESLKMLRAALPTSIAIHFNHERESGAVFADPTQLQQVIINLCTNAAHAMREKGGVITLTLSEARFNSTADVPAPDIAPGTYVKFSVEDTGRGIPPELINRVFEPFFTTKQQGEGSGLGLSVVHGIIRSHRGAVTVASEPGKGATFTIYLPRYKAPLTDESEDEGLVATGTERILFIDDEPQLAEMGGEMLRGLGYDVTRKTNPREALALFRLNPSNFDLVVTDQTMPEISGLELANELLTTRPDLPIVLCTGFSHQVDATSAQGAGVRAFVHKPLTKSEIGRVIRRVLDAKKK
jgi:CheY-like chemotaxis protein